MALLENQLENQRQNPSSKAVRFEHTKKLLLLLAADLIYDFLGSLGKLSGDGKKGKIQCPEREIFL